MHNHFMQPCFQDFSPDHLPTISTLISVVKALAKALFILCTWHYVDYNYNYFSDRFERNG